MIYLLFSILSSIGIFLVFRLFKTYDIYTRHGIMINYLVAAATGLVIFQPDLDWWRSEWFILSCFLGTMFYLVFRVMARVTQENGLSVSSIATKMSVVVPVSVGLVVLDESLNAWKIAGIIVGIISIFLTSGSHVKQGNWIWPIILFAGSGVVDSCIKLFEHYYISIELFPVFVTNIFLFAFISAFIHHLFTRERKLKPKAFAGGLALGIVNFTALYYILQSLALPGWESSVVFPINNFGIIAGSTLLAMIAFGERMNLRGWMGFILASVSILLLYLSK